MKNANTKRRTQEQSGSLTVVKAQVETKLLLQERRESSGIPTTVTLATRNFSCLCCDPVCVTVTLFTPGESRAALSPGTRHGINKYSDQQHTATNLYTVHVTI